MKISIVLATFNGEKFIINQLNSIMNQTLLPTEVIISDDCSADSTVKLVNDYSNQNRNVEWVISVNKKNIGFADNFNQATEKATGDYIFFSDQDDIWEQDKVEKMVNFMEAHRECKVLCSEYVPFISGDIEKKIPQEVIDNIKNDGTVDQVSFSKNNIYLHTLGCCMAIRKTFIEEIGKYWFEGWAQDDRMWKLALASNGLYMYNTTLVKHRIHANNTATYGKYHNLKKRTDLFRNMYQAVVKMLEYCNENNVEKKKKDIVAGNVAMMKLRLDMLLTGNIFFSVPLLKYISYYQKKKSWLVEPILICKNKMTNKGN